MLFFPIIPCPLFCFSNIYDPCSFKSARTASHHLVRGLSFFFLYFDTVKAIIITVLHSCHSHHVPQSPWSACRFPVPCRLQTTFCIPCFKNISYNYQFQSSQCLNVYSRAELMIHSQSYNAVGLVIVLYTLNNKTV